MFPAVAVAVAALEGLAPPEKSRKVALVHNKKKTKTYKKTRPFIVTATQYYEKTGVASPERICAKKNK